MPSLPRHLARVVERHPDDHPAARARFLGKLGMTFIFK